MGDTANPWLLLIHQIPPRPPYVRVKIWRRLQALGAVAIKNSVYALPASDQAREDFEWTRRQILEIKGEASVCEARLVDGLTDQELRAAFVAAREADYRDIVAEARAVARGLGRRRSRRPLAEEAAARLETALARLERRVAQVGAIDFFGAPGRETVEGLLRDLEARLVPARSKPDPGRKAARSAGAHRGRVWVTRSGVHVDRIASAWLIRTQIDPDATFRFVAAGDSRRREGELRFDMFEAEFTHDGDLCTFEVLVRDFGLTDAALAPIAEIVHEIDLRDGKHARPEVPGIERLIAGIARSTTDDEERLRRGAVVLDALFSFFRRRRSGAALTTEA